MDSTDSSASVKPGRDADEDAGDVAAAAAVDLAGDLARLVGQVDGDRA